MHESVTGSLEEYLRDPASAPETEAHLRTCESCRKEVDAMRAQSRLFRSVKPPDEVEPFPGFYARVMNRIETQARPSIWSLFGESLFAKRLVYASAACLVLFGTFLISDARRDDAMLASAPETILAGEHMPEPVTMDPQKDREVILVKLATYGDGDSSAAPDFQ